jgi:ABC-2 type transport system ATP-binding protein
MAPVIEIQDLSKRFQFPSQQGRTLQAALLGVRKAQKPDNRAMWALRDVSLSIDKGETVGIIGPNGSGKSTLLKIMAGVLQPSEGTVKVHEPSLALLELGAGFRTDLTGAENIRMYGALFGLDKEATQNCLQAAIEFADLGHFIDVPVRTYSSGMQARLAMAAAVSLSAPIIIIDEVLAVGDTVFREKTLKRLANLRLADHTIVIVSHELGIIERLCDRVIVLFDGSLVHQGEPQETILYYLRRTRQEQAQKLRGADSAQENTSTESPIEIIGAETLDETGSPQQVFSPGDTLNLRVRYYVHEPFDSPVFQVQIRDPSSRKEPIVIFGTNSDRTGFQARKTTGEGTFTIAYRQIPLLSGEYSFHVAVLPNVFSPSPLSWKSELAVFRIESTWSEGGGLTKIAHEWIGESNEQQ